MARILFLLAVCFLASEQQALAYVDPASGSMIMQVIIAAVGAIGYALSVFWGKIRQLHGKKNGKN